MNVVRTILFALFAYPSFALGAPADSARDPVEVAADAQFSPDYRIGVDDVLKVSVWRNDDLSVTVPRTLNLGRPHSGPDFDFLLP